MGYFKAFPIDSGTWYIKELLGVGSFLFLGNERGLLLDTCNGFRDIRKTIAKLAPYLPSAPGSSLGSSPGSSPSSSPGSSPRYAPGSSLNSAPHSSNELPQNLLTVLNTHGHADHAGGNSLFKKVYIHQADVKMTDAEWQKNQRDTLFGYARKRYPILRPVLFWLERNRPNIYDTEIKTIEDGASFELGGRELTVIHFPGHSPGSIILADKQTKTLYTGDAINDGLFLFFEDSPTLKEYAARLRTLSALQGYDEIRASHSDKPLPFLFIEYYADFLERASLDKSEVTDFPNNDKTVYVYKEKGTQFGLPSISVHFTKDSV